MSAAAQPGTALLLARGVCRALAQLGFEYGYGADGNDGPPLLDELAWGRHASVPGRLGGAEPLFPRLDVEAAETAVDSAAG